MPGLELLRLVSPLPKAAARPRVNGPIAWGLARSLALGAGGGWGCGTSASARGGPSRILSNRDAIPSESSLLSLPSLPSSSLGDSSSGSPLCLDFARCASNAWRLRFFFFSSLFFESLADFCFSADWRRLSRSTSSSFTGGLEDRTSIDPYKNKGKLKEGSKKIQN